VLWLLAAALVSGCGSAQVIPADVPEWQILFDGTDLNQWQGLNRDNIPAGHWQIEGDTLRKVPGKEAPLVSGNAPGYGGDIRSRDTYQNFELCFEFRLSEGANSGVKYNVSAALSAQHGHPGAAIGFEYQLLDDANHPDAKMGRNGNRTVASLYDILPASATKPTVLPQRWHEGCVLADGNQISHLLDGDVVLRYDVASSAFTEALAASKFAAMDGFSERKRGYIVLQDHFDEVWYRNIRIRLLH